MFSCSEFPQIIADEGEKTTFEQDLKEKDEFFLQLSGEERLRMMRTVSERMRKPGMNYQLEGAKVTVKRTG
jgi:hypothetical protein